MAVLEQTNEEIVTRLLTSNEILGRSVSDKNYLSTTSETLGSYLKTLPIEESEFVKKSRISSSWDARFLFIK